MFFALATTAFFVPKAYADSNLYSTVNSINATSGNISLGSTFQSLGTGLSGVLNSGAFYMNVPSGSTQTFRVQLLVCPTSSYTGCSVPLNSLGHQVSMVGINVTGNVGPVSYFPNFIDNTTGLVANYSFDPTMYYELRYDSTGGAGSLQVQGCSSSCYANGVFSGGSGVADAGFALNGVATNTSFPYIYNLSPSNGSTTQSTNVSFSMSYNAISSYNIATWNFTVVDITAQLSGLATSTYKFILSGSSSSGFNSATSTVTLTAGHLYNVTGYLCTSNGSCYSGAPANRFSVISDYTTSVGSVLNSYGGLISTSTPTCTSPSSILDVGGGVTWAFCQLFIPQLNVVDQFYQLPTLLSTKIPFSYVADIYTIFGNITLNATSSLPLIDIPISHYASSTVTGDIPDLIISTTTISTYLSDNVRIGLNALLTAAIWLAAGWQTYSLGMSAF